MTTTIPRPIPAAASAKPGTFVRKGPHGKGGYVVTAMDEFGDVEVQWDAWMPGCTEYVRAGVLSVPEGGADYRPVHLRVGPWS